MQVRERIDGCLSGEAEAWAELWQIVEGVGGRQMCRLLIRAGLAAQLADDVLQQLYLYLRTRNYGFLHQFNGCTEREWRCYLRTIAVRFTQRFIRCWKRQARREQLAGQQLRQPNRAGPTETEVARALEALERLMPPIAFANLKELRGQEWPQAPAEHTPELQEPAIPARTKRERLRVYCQRYSRRLLDQLE